MTTLFVKVPYCAEVIAWENILRADFLGATEEQDDEEEGHIPARPSLLTLYLREITSDESVSFGTRRMIRGAAAERMWEIILQRSWIIASDHGSEKDPPRS